MAARAARVHPDAGPREGLARFAIRDGAFQDPSRGQDMGLVARLCLAAGRDVQHLEGEALVPHLETNPQPGAEAAQLEPALSVRGHGGWPQGQVRRGVEEHQYGRTQQRVRLIFPGPARQAQMGGYPAAQRRHGFGITVREVATGESDVEKVPRSALDGLPVPQPAHDQLDAGRRLPLQVDEPPADNLLRLKLDGNAVGLRRGCPAQAVTLRGSQDHDFRRLDLGRARHGQAELALRVGPGLAERLHAARQQRRGTDHDRHLGPGQSLPVRAKHLPGDLEDRGSRIEDRKDLFLSILDPRSSIFGGGGLLLALGLGLIDTDARAEHHERGRQHQGGCDLELAEEHGFHGPLGQRQHGGRGAFDRTGHREAGEPGRGRQQGAGQGRGRLLRQQGRQQTGRKAQAAPPQAHAQQVAGPSQPALHRADRAAEQLGCLGVRLAFEVAEHDRGSIAVRESVQLLIQDGLQFTPEFHGGRLLTGQVNEGSLAALAAEGVGPRLERDVIGDRVQPTADGRVPVEGTRPAQQDEKSGLEGVLDGVGILQQPPAHAQDHRPVPLHQSGKGRLLVSRQEAVQELAVSQFLGVRHAGQPVDVAQDSAELPVAHGSGPLQKVSLPL
ncbi:MAG: hypothetical protein L0Z62_45380 [Gemmataceae bacterium]|nr:hypothetical protein [Gemmataceae bacterium]